MKRNTLAILSKCYQDISLGFILLLTLSTAQAAFPLDLSRPDPSAKLRIIESYGKLPLGFEPNQGQTDGAVRFLSRGPGYTLFLTPTEAVLALRGPEETLPPNPSPLLKGEGERGGQVVTVRMKLIGANPKLETTGLDVLPGTVNYFRGKDPKHWRRHIPTYARVKYAQVYPGVDLVYYGNQQQLEYDFVVAPGSDPGVIRLALSGAEKVAIDAQGDVVLSARDGEVRLRKPDIYQEVNGERRKIEGCFVQYDSARGDTQIGFQVAAYDKTKPLIIDPEVGYSTYLGGSDGEQGLDIVVDSAGNAYVTGMTQSSENFPITVEARDRGLEGEQDAFVTKFSSTGKEALFSTYLGGNEGSENGSGIAVDGAGNIYVTGQTDSSDFPITANAPFPELRGVTDAFVTKFLSTGEIRFSTYLGGSGESDSGSGIAVDSARNIYVTGQTDSSDFPNAINSSFGGQDAFMTKFSLSGEVLFSTYLGGSDLDGGQGIAIDSADNVNVYVVGSTHSSDFPKVNALDAELGGEEDAFVTRFSPEGSVLFSTYLGGSDEENGTSIAVDGDGNICVTGNTDSSDFPNAINSSFGGQDAFVTKFSSSSEIRFSTYLGGSGELDSGSDIAVDGDGNIYVTGQTDSSDFPKVNALDAEVGGEKDAFVTRFSPEGAVLFSTYLGGNDFDGGHGIAVDSANNIYVTGDTESSDFPPVNAHSSTLGGPNDAFVVKITPNAPPEVKESPQRPEPCDIPSPLETGKKKGLVLIAHGWNSKPEDWANQMADSIRARISGDPTIDWQVFVCDWQEDAKAVSSCEEVPNQIDPSCYFDSWNAYVNAINHGQRAAQQIVDKRYEVIHFIAHGAGSNLIDTAAAGIAENTRQQGINKPLIHSTFLDAFDPRQNSSTYGRGADWAEHYVDMRRTNTPEFDNTDLILPRTFNLDVTALDLGLDNTGTHAHAWPHQWYQTTIDKPLGEFGFPLALEAGNTQLLSHDDPKFPRGAGCRLNPNSNLDALDGCQIKVRAPETEREIVCTNLADCNDRVEIVSQPINVPQESVDDTALLTEGVIGLSTDSPKLKKAASDKAVSRASVRTSIPLDIKQPINTLRFDYQFKNKAQGLLSVFIDNQVLHKFDQRLSKNKEGVNPSHPIPLGQVPLGKHILSFRIDKFKDQPLAVEISKIRTENIQSDHNCQGKSVTVIGTDGDDTLVGTLGDDVIDGLAGNDTIRGRGGDDVICGRGGDDTLRGGGGNDSLGGGGGNDALKGGSSNDQLKGGGGADKLDGGADIDSCIKGEENLNCEE